MPPPLHVLHPGAPFEPEERISVRLLSLLLSSLPLICDDGEDAAVACGVPGLGSCQAANVAAYVRTHYGKAHAKLVCRHTIPVK